MFFGEPHHGHPDRGRAITSFIVTIKDDIGLEKTTEIRDIMLDQALRENVVRMAGGDSRPKEEEERAPTGRTANSRLATMTTQLVFEQPAPGS